MPFFFILHTPELIRILTTTTSMTARLLSLAVLILSLAPLGSMYFLLTSSSSWDGAWNPHRQENYNHHHSLMYSFVQQQKHSASNNEIAFEMVDMEATMKLLFQAMQSPNATTLEELWTAIFLGPASAAASAHAQPQQQNNRFTPPVQSFHYQNPAAAAAARLMSPLIMAQQLPHHEWTLWHIKAILPWFVSFFLGFVVPSCLSIWSFVRQQRQRNERQRKREKRVQKTMLALERFTTTLTANDQVASIEASCKEDNRMIDKEPPYDSNYDDRANLWKVPSPGVPLCDVRQETNDSNNPDNASSPATTRTVVGTCAICLNHYAIHESIVWSPNPDCIHCFHEDCIKSWLVRSSRRNAMTSTPLSLSSSHNPTDQNDQPCPCCRQPFVLPVTKKLTKMTTMT